MLAGSARRFLDAVVSRPDTWRIILLPSEGTPAVVRDHVETNRARTLERVQELVRWTIKRSVLLRELNVELAGRAMQSLAEEAGRVVLTDAETRGPARYERFVRAVVSALVAAARQGTFKQDGDPLPGSPPPGHYHLTSTAGLDAIDGMTVRLVKPGGRGKVATRSGRFTRPHRTLRGEHGHHGART